MTVEHTPRDPETPGTTGGGPHPMDEDDRRCRATARSGDRCKRYAIPGGRVCVMHGGASPQARAAAERRRAEAEATALLEQVWNPDAPPVDNVVVELHQMAGQLRHSIQVLGARLTTEGLDGSAGLAWSQVLGHQRRLLADIARLGIDAKLVQLEQDRAELVTGAFLTAVDRLQLSPGERSTSVRTFLDALGRRGDPVPALGEGTQQLTTEAASDIATVVLAILERLELTPEQWTTARRVAPEELRRAGAEVVSS